MNVVVSPHLDDAVLSAWLVLDSKQPRVVTCFAGLPDDTGGAGLVHARRRENAAALAALGCEDVPLDLLDRRYRPNVPQAEVTRELAAALLPTLDGAVDVWMPVGLGRHADHVTARKATVQALRAIPVCRGHAYADLPYASLRGWPSWLATADQRAVWQLPLFWRVTRAQVQWAHHLARVAHVVDVAHPLVHRLTQAQRSKKGRAVATYLTQVGPLGYAADEDVQCEGKLAYEVYWPLRRSTSSPGLS